MARTNQNPHYP